MFMIINVLNITSIPTNNEQPNKLLKKEINPNNKKLYIVLLLWKEISNTDRYSK